MHIRLIVLSKRDRCNANHLPRTKFTLSIIYMNLIISKLSRETEKENHSNRMVVKEVKTLGCYSKCKQKSRGEKTISRFAYAAIV